MNVAQAHTARTALRGAGMCMRCLVRRSEAVSDRSFSPAPSAPETAPH
ncbi:hypothetical protein HMPREF1129_0759 [Actinomyces naeslundii str. Howell 279]|uniref:Uncharacterized protein n=1 Tax=Actinomyces naeslundii (strain ATCC 12104 / DSM 43013 / CCUG 2238 / JCM 8349 / NCTC 10301 / Howell 279) TaxID=1115803 RepID=J3F2L2_ACTNH|nr:hypothetical protein HMPREF1129_0759 [Actinomyces naeslundii str. Howell 279]